MTAAWIPALGLSLLHFLWQGALVWAGAALLLRLGRHAGPRFRHAVALTGLAICGLLPVVGTAGRLASPAMEGTGALAEVPAGLRLKDVREITPESVGSLRPVLATRSLETRLRPHLDTVVWVWAFGMLLLALRTGAGLWWVRRLERGSTEPAPDAWAQRMKDLAHRMDIGRPLRLKISRAIDSPLVLGWWRPVILLPASALAGMDPVLLEALLVHELAHVKRLDYLVNLLQSAVETVLFYHPAVWWLSRQVRIERELLCDERAAGILGEPRRLALALRELDLLQLATPHLAQGAHGGNLMQRIRHLIQPETRPFALKAALSLAALAGLALGGTALVARQRNATPAPEVAAPEVAVSGKPRRDKDPEPQYAFGIKGKQGISGSWNTRHEAEINHLQTKLDRDVLWFREAGTSYVIDDPTTVAKARAIYQPVETLGEKMGALGGQMGDLGGKMGSLGGEMGKIGGQLGEIGGRMGGVGGRIAEVSVRLNAPNLKEADRPRLEQELKGLEAKMKDLEQEMERANKASEGSMKDLEAQMKVHEAPMNALSKQMDALGKEMDAASKKVDGEMANLIQQARREGKVAKAADRLK